MPEMKTKAPEKALEKVSATVKLPKALHIKLTQIAASEGKSLAQTLTQAAREHAASYERTSKTVTAYTRKKK